MHLSNSLMSLMGSDQDSANFMVDLLAALTRDGQPVLVELILTVAIEQLLALFSVVELTSISPSTMIDFAVVDPSTGRNALHEAVLLGDDRLVASLLAVGASEDHAHRRFDLEATDKEGRTSLMMAMYPEDGTPEPAVVGALLRYGAKTDESVLFDLLQHAPESLAATVIEASEFDLAQMRCPLHNDRTALHAVAKRTAKGGAKLTKLLIKRGAQVDVQGSHGHTPLYLAVTAAVANGKAEDVNIEALLEAGADPLVYDDQGDTALAVAIRGARLLRNSRKSDRESRLSSLLLAHCAKKAVQADSELMLEAVKAEDKLLLEEILPVDLVLPLPLVKDWPVLWWAAYFGLSDLADRLLTGDPRGATFQDKDGGRTLLHWLGVWGGAPSIAQLVPKLIAAKVNVALPDSNGKTASQLAAAAGNLEVAHALRHSGGMADATSQCSELAKAEGHLTVAEMLEADRETFCSTTVEEWLSRRVRQPSQGSSSADGSATSAPSTAEAVVEDAASFNAVVAEVPIAKDKAASMFVDLDFRPIQASLVGKREINADYRRVEWHRIQTICGDRSTIFPEGSLDTDGLYSMGACGSPWWWIALSSTEETQLRSMIPQRTLSRDGHYLVKLCADSEVVIDDFVPCMRSEVTGALEPAFGHMGEYGTVWSLLLCKAYAKLAGGYSNLFEGLHVKPSPEAQAIINVLTTSPIIEVGLRNEFANMTREVATVATLGGILVHSPLSQGKMAEAAVSALIGDLVGALSSVRVGKDGETPQIMLAVQGMPAFELRIVNEDVNEDISLELMVQGNVPSDLTIQLFDSNYTEVYRGQMDLRTGVLLLPLKRFRQPYILSFSTSLDLASMYVPEWDVDFDCDADLEITLCKTLKTATSPILRETAYELS